MNVPDLVKAFFEADRRNDPDSVAKNFAVDAVVVDEGAFHQGGAAIRDWWVEAKRKTQYVAEPLDATVNVIDRSYEPRSASSFREAP
jgi:ketosteroid isomerase-like protein